MFTKPTLLTQSEDMEFDTNIVECGT
jgi:hypothetical protein